MPSENAYAFEFEGKQYRLKTLMLAEARAIQKATGKTIVQFTDGLVAGDADCLTALVWVARKREEPTLKFEDVDGDVLSFKDLEEDEPPAEEPRAEGNGQAPAPEAAQLLTVTPPAPL